MKEYGDKLIYAFNNRYAYISEHYPKFQEGTKAACEKTYENATQKVLQCLLVLGYEVEKPETFLGLFDETTLTKVTQGAAANLSTAVNASNLLDSHAISGSIDSVASINSEAAYEQGDAQTDSNRETQIVVVNSESVMPLTPVEFLKFAGGQISKTFSGEPLALQPFLNSVALIKTIAGADNADLLKSFVLSKLEGAALECIPADPADINAITNALKANIKPDSSDIVAGRLQALKLQKGNLAEYAKKAEDLAEAFQRQKK